MEGTWFSSTRRGALSLYVRPPYYMEASAEKMQRKFVLVITLIFLSSFIACERDKNPVVELVVITGYNKISILTDSTLYNWQVDEQTKFVFIQGTLINKSDSVFYSRLGDGFGPPEPLNLYLAGNSEGYLEKYYSQEDVWKVQNFALYIIEGTKIVPIKPGQTYSISSVLSRASGVNESGTYRFRIDYYDTANPDSTTVPYHDYSNTFEIL